MLQQESVFLASSLHHQQQQHYDSSPGLFSPASCCADGSSSPGSSPVDFYQQQPYSPEYGASESFLSASPFSGSSMAQPSSPSSQALPGLSSSHRSAGGRSVHPYQPIYQNWTYAPASRAQRRQAQPEVYAKRRATANLRERGRMSEMNRAFDLLRNLVPSYPACGRKMSKIDTLRLAKQYIQDLEKLVSDGTVAEGYDFRLRLVEQHRGDCDSSDGDYSSPSPASSSGLSDSRNGPADFPAAALTC